MTFQPFSFTGIPKIFFGAGAIKDAPDFVDRFGKRVLCITGSSSYKTTGRWDSFCRSLDEKSITFYHAVVHGEPSPEQIDEVVSEHKDKHIDVVLSWGGGSVVDTGKAVSAMLLQNGSVADYLEGIGLPENHSGLKVPFIAVPTTAGTGSEATKNAVISKVGKDGFKKSLRDDNFVPDIAMIDPELMIACPENITAACGMDALSQLLESYISIKSSPMTDALALSGLKAVGKSFIPACTNKARDVSIRGDMAYAALISGITLANAGLGIVHGIAGPLGGFFPIPHGVACGTLLAAATETTIRRLLSIHGPDHPMLGKFATAGSVFLNEENKDVLSGCDMLISRLYKLTMDLNIPKLGKYGITTQDLDIIVSASNNKNNPYKLDKHEIKGVLERCL